VRILEGFALTGAICQMAWNQGYDLYGYDEGGGNYGPDSGGYDQLGFGT
jgi:hypothetical protein